MQDVRIARIVEPFLTQADRTLGTDYSAVVYGSAARGEYLPGVSDVNLLLVAGTLSTETLRGLAPALTVLREEGGTPPLLAERAEWTRAADVFPIELTDMGLARQVVRGPDPVAPLRVEPRDLRHALETELRGRLLRLRQAYAASADDPEALAAVGTRSIASVLTLVRCLLVLSGRTVPPGGANALAEAGRGFGIAVDPVIVVWGKRGAGAWNCPPALFEGYLAAVAAAVQVVDQLHSGGQ